MLRLLGALGIGAAAMYFLDPENGRKRWALARVVRKAAEV